MARKQLPAVADVAPRADWSEWSADQERRRIQTDIDERRRVMEDPIYPREIAEKIAKDVARTLVPDWHLLRQEQRGFFVKLLRQQPALQQREVRQMDSLLNLIADNLPRHLQPLLHDLRTILELRLVAHEAAAFLVGVETGRRLERQYVDGQGRVRTRSGGSPSDHCAPSPDGALRLHLSDAASVQGGA